MSRDQVIASMCRLPAESKTRDVPILELLRQSGFSESNDISEQEIESYLRQYPDLTKSWIRHSEDQRTSTGWWITGPLNPEMLNSDWFESNTDVARGNFLSLHAEGKWTVGDYPITVQQTFEDEFKAVAFFVWKKVSELAEMAERAR